MPQDPGPQRIGVFGAEHGWLVALADRGELFATRDDALAAALRLAHLARWRGGEAEVISQEGLGGPLSVVERRAVELRR
jgi:hypothetical protein